MHSDELSVEQFKVFLEQYMGKTAASHIVDGLVNAVEPLGRFVMLFDWWNKMCPPKHGVSVVGTVAYKQPAYCGCCVLIFFFSFFRIEESAPVEESEMRPAFQLNCRCAHLHLFWLTFDA